MINIYILAGVIICATFAYASAIGWNLIDPAGAIPSKPQGPGHYHK